MESPSVLAKKREISVALMRPFLMHYSLLSAARDVQTGDNADRILGRTGPLHSLLADFGEALFALEQVSEIKGFLDSF